MVNLVESLSNSGMHAFMAHKATKKAKQTHTYIHTTVFLLGEEMPSICINSVKTMKNNTYMHKYTV